MNLENRATEIYEAGREEFEKFRGQLIEACLVSSTPKLFIMKQTKEFYTVEFRIEFLYEGQLVDILEFFVFREGALVSSEEEMRLWIHEDVADVIARQNQRLQLSRGSCTEKVPSKAS